MVNLSIWHAPNVTAAVNISLWGSWASCFCYLSRSNAYVVGINLMTLWAELLLKFQHKKHESESKITYTPNTLLPFIQYTIYYTIFP